MSHERPAPLKDDAHAPGFANVYRPANAIREAVAAADRQVSAWLDGLADTIDRGRTRYWRGDISTYAWQGLLADSVAEMRDVAKLLRERPMQRKDGGQ